jgi:peptide/nickel transport system permease protein
MVAVERSEAEMAPRLARRHVFLQALLASRKASFGVAIVLLIVIAAALSPLLAPYDPDVQSLGARLLPPLSHAHDQFHLLGTDQLGRDILSRLIYGARISLVIGVSASIIAGTFGISLGLIAGYFGGRTDDAIMRLSDVQLALPYILVALAILAIVGNNVFNLVLVLSGTQWVTYARVIRSGVLSVKEQEYVQAARTLGLTHSRIILRYILPNVFAPAIVIATFSVAQTIVAEAGLSFLGLGVPPSVPSWGGMLADGRTYLVVAWWLVTVPGVAISLTVIGVNLFGDWLRDYLDPKLRL